MFTTKEMFITLLLSSVTHSFGFQGLNLIPTSRRFVEPTIMIIERPESLIKLTNNFVQTNFGISDSSFLAPGVIVIDKLRELGKEKYLSEFSKSYSAISRCIPDLDYRPSAFLYDDSDPDVIRCVIRPIGIHSVL